MPLNDWSSTKGKLKSTVSVSFSSFDFSSSIISLAACSSKLTTLLFSTAFDSFTDVFGDALPLDNFDFSFWSMSVSSVFSLFVLGSKMSASILLRILSCQDLEPNKGIIRGSSFFSSSLK